MNSRLIAIALPLCVMVSIGASALGQRTLQVTACDDGQPLPYATVLVRGEARLTDADGKISIADTDTAEVRCVGYAPRTVMPGTNDVCLDTKVYNLAPVVIGAKKTVVTFGQAPQKRSSGSWYFYKLPIRVVTLVKPDNSLNMRVEQAHIFFINYDSLPGSNRPYAPIQLILYNIDTATGKPTGANLLPEVFVQIPHKGKHSVVVDLTQYNIRLPSTGLFFGIAMPEFVSGRYDLKTGKLVPAPMSKISIGVQKPSSEWERYYKLPSWGTRLQLSKYRRKKYESYYINHGDWDKDHWVSFRTESVPAFQLTASFTR